MKLAHENSKFYLPLLRTQSTSFDRELFVINIANLNTELKIKFTCQSV